MTELDIDQLSESDINALDIVLQKFGDENGMFLSEFSHSFPEWTYYQGMIEGKEAKRSCRVSADHFFESCGVDDRGLFNQNSELLTLPKNCIISITGFR